MDIFKKFNQGDVFKPSAAQLNSWIGAARATSAKGSPTGGTKGNLDPLGFRWVWVKNTTGADREQYDCVSLKNVVVRHGENASEYTDRPYFKAIAPDPSVRPAVFLEPCPDGAIRKAAVGGLVPCRVNLTAESQKRATFVADQYGHLSGGGSGYEIVDVDLGDQEDEEWEFEAGVKKAIIDFGNGGKAGGFDTGFGDNVDLQACMIVGTIPAATVSVSTSGGLVTGISRTPGSAPGLKCVCPMRIDKSGWVNGKPLEAPDFINETDPESEEDEILIVEGWNYWEDFDLVGGDGKEQMGPGETEEDPPVPTGRYNDPPLWGLGYKTVRLEENPDPEAEEEYVEVKAFAILLVNNPVIIYHAILANAMSPGDSQVEVDSDSDIWGKRPQGQRSPYNSLNWYANAGAAAIVLRGYGHEVLLNVDGVCEDDYEPDPPPEDP